MVNIIADSIAALNKKQQATDTGVAESGVDNVITLGQRILLGIKGEYRVIKVPYSTTSFILDHPVYGELDSSTLELDGGYSEGTPSSFSLPATMPITFSGETGTSTLMGSGLL